ncbi:35660_t:CDS:2, partial [Racocetra persica]
EEKHEEQRFFDEPEIEKANLQHETSLIIELQPVQELPIHKEGFLDLDVEVPWPVRFPYNKEYQAKEIDLASVILGAENEDEAMQEVYLQCLYQNYSEEEEINKIIKLVVDAYRAFENEDEAIQKLFLQCLYCNYSEKKINETIKLAVNKRYKNWLRYVEDQIESKKIEAGMTEERAQRILNTIDNYEYLIRVKFIRDDTVISVEKTKKGFKIINKYEPIRESKKAGGHGLTEICRQKINDWEKKIRIPGARVQDVAELEKILKRLIKLLDITHGTIFNSGKYRSGPQAIWLMGVRDTSQTIFQFVLEDDWQYQEGIINKEKKSILSESLKVVDLAEQHGHGGYWNAPDYHVNDVVCIDMKECYPASMQGQGECTPWFNRFGHLSHYLVRVAVNGELPEDDITRFAQVRSFKFASNIHSAIPIWYRKHFAYQSREGCGKAKGWASIILLRYLLEVGILESVTIGEAIISLTKQTKVWLPRNRDISCAIIGKFTQGGKIDEKRLTHRLVTDEGELDFLIKDCTDARTFAGREKCSLGFILTYYKGHQPQYTHLRASMLAYAHINLLEMLRRFDSNKVVKIVTDSIYVRKEALYKIENIPAFFKQVEVKSDPNLCSHYPSCAMCTDPEEFFISKSEYAKWIKEFQKTKTPLVKYDCKRYKPFICRFCFAEWFYRPDSYALLHQPKEQEIREIQPDQWHDKGEKIYRPIIDIVYWPKNRHWESIKNISESTAPSIYDPITRYQKSYLNGGGGLEKTTCAIRIFKNINMVVFTHTNALAKDF